METYLYIIGGILVALNIVGLLMLYSLHRKANTIGEVQHMQVFHPEHLLDDRCDGLEEEGAWVLVEPGDPGAIEGTTAPYIMWDEGGSDE